MTDVLRIVLPADLIPIIKEYTGETRMRNGVLMHQFKNKDRRFKLLRSITQKIQFAVGTHFNECDRRGFVTLKTPDKKKHIGISVYYEMLRKALVWEMNTLGGNTITTYI
jgi:hypothetical protein